MKKLSVSLIILIVCIFMPALQTYAAQMYADTPNSHWGIADIEYLAHRDYMIGADDGNFYPDDYLTREQAIRLINVLTGDARHFGPLEDTHVFEDVALDRWSMPDIANAINSSRPFLERAPKLYPEEPVTRQDFSVWIYRACHLESVETSKSKFADEALLSYPDAIYTLRELGFIDGFEDNTFRPNEPLTRAEAAAIGARVARYVNKFDISDFHNIEKVKLDIAVDLDGDGMNDEIYTEMDEIYRQTEGSEGGGRRAYFTLYVGNTEWTQELYGSDVEKIDVIDIDERDKYKEIMIFKTFSDPCIIRYDGRDLYFVSSVSGNAVIDGSGEIATAHMFSAREYVSDNSTVTYYFNNRGRFSVNPTGGYKLGIVRTALNALSYEGDAVHNGIDIEAGETVTFVLYQNARVQKTMFHFQWIYLETDTGKSGWIRTGISLTASGVPIETKIDEMPLDHYFEDPPMIFEQDSSTYNGRTIYSR